MQYSYSQQRRLTFDTIAIFVDRLKAHKQSANAVRSKMLPGRNQLVIVLALLALASSPGQPKPQAEAFVAEAAEIIGVVRIGVSLVDYIYKVFKPIISDSDISARDITEKRKIDREILREYKVISSALDRMSQNNEQVRATMLKLKDTIPTIVR